MHRTGEQILWGAWLHLSTPRGTPVLTPARLRGLVVVFNPSRCYCLLCPCVEHLIPGQRGTEPVLHKDHTVPLYCCCHDGSITNMRVLGTMGNVPRGGLTRSLEHDLSRRERTGGPSRRNWCFAEHGQCNQYLYSNDLSLLCEGVLNFFCILCSLRWIYFFLPPSLSPSHHSSWGNDERVHTVQRMGVLGVLISRLIPEN